MNQDLMIMIQARMNNRIDALNSLTPSTIENLPDDIKKMREIEAGRIRAVIEEQKDLIETIKMLSSL